MSSVVSCHALAATGGTAKTDDVGAVLGGTWTEVGTLAGANGIDGWLTAFVTDGSWGSLPASGSLLIDEDMWARYGRAAITFHLGNGGGNPDWFFFELSPLAASSSFQIVRLSGTGGGLSNIVLWGSSAPAVTPSFAAPEPQSLLIMGAGLVALAAIMRRRRRSHAAM